MSFLLEIVLTQSVGILLGLAAIFYISPDTTGGALLLLVIAVALSNAVQQIYKNLIAK
jgi:hypothetical protein